MLNMTLITTFAGQPGQIRFPLLCFRLLNLDQKKKIMREETRWITHCMCPAREGSMSLGTMTPFMP